VAVELPAVELDYQVALRPEEVDSVAIYLRVDLRPGQAGS